MSVSKGALETIVGLLSKSAVADLKDAQGDYVLFTLSPDNFIHIIEELTKSTIGDGYKVHTYVSHSNFFETKISKKDE